MPPFFPKVESLRQLPLDGWLLFATRFVRLFAYGLLAVVLVLYLAETGMSIVSAKKMTGERAYHGEQKTESQAGNVDNHRASIAHCVCPIKPV